LPELAGLLLGVGLEDLDALAQGLGVFTKLPGERTVDAVVEHLGQHIELVQCGVEAAIAVRADR
jgi:hypothetical protein